MFLNRRGGGSGSPTGLRMKNDYKASRSDIPFVFLQGG